MMCGFQEMPADTAESLDDAVDDRETLEVRDRLEAAHLPFALSRRFMGHLSAVVGVLVPAMDDRGNHGAASGSIAGQLVGDESARRAALPFQQLAEEPDRSALSRLAWSRRRPPYSFRHR